MIVHLSRYTSFWLTTYRDDENRYRTVTASLAKEIGKDLDQLKWQLIRLWYEAEIWRWKHNYLPRRIWLYYNSIIVTITIADFVKNRKIFFLFTYWKEKLLHFRCIKTINNLLYKIQALYLHHTFRGNFKRTISIAFNRNRWVFLLIYLNKRYRRLKRYFLNGRWKWVCYR